MKKTSTNSSNESSTAVEPIDGICYLVGAGPGDPGLLTLRGRECLERADVVIYDYLSNAEFLRFAPASAEKIYAGKTAGQHALKQEETNALLVKFTREGKRVVRLKGGDPFLFGRGGEEAAELAAAGLRFEIVPGVTSAIGGWPMPASPSPIAPAMPFSRSSPAMRSRTKRPRASTTRRSLLRQARR